MSDAPTCPICSRVMEDRRHVGVECFYDVHEVAPLAEKKEIFTEVPDEGAYWGITRRYPEGQRDKFHSESTGPNSSKLINEPESCGPIRLIEKSIYSVECCKACRGDFLTMFGEWAKGLVVTHHEPDDEHSIPVRRNGRTVFLSQKQWELQQGGRRL